MTRNQGGAAAVAEFGMMLRESPYKGNATWEGVLEWAERGRSVDLDGYRREFMGLVRRAREIAGR